MSAADRDPDVLSIPEAARFAGYSDRSFRARLDSANDHSLADAVLVAFGETARKTISLPRLCRYLHGAEADALIPEWRERVTASRRREQVAS